MGTDGGGRTDDNGLKAGLVAGDADAGKKAASATAASSSSGRRGGGDVEPDPSSYAALSVGDEDPHAKMPVWNFRWMGRILVLRLPCGVVFIGPHWYCCLIMLTFIVGVGGFFTNCSVNSTQALSGVAVTVMTTVAFLRCALSNPGVLERVDGPGRTAAAEEGAAQPFDVEPASGARGMRGRRSTTEGQRCSVCDVIQPRGCSHCEYCQCCIEGFDHHCPWMGKCIGKDNLCAFRSFICIAMTSLGYIFVSTAILGEPGYTTPEPYVLHRMAPN